LVYFGQIFISLSIIFVCYLSFWRIFFSFWILIFLLLGFALILYFGIFSLKFFLMFSLKVCLLFLFFQLIFFFLFLPKIFFWLFISIWIVYDLFPKQFCQLLKLWVRLYFTLICYFTVIFFRPGDNVYLSRSSNSSINESELFISLFCFLSLIFSISCLFNRPFLFKIRLLVAKIQSWNKN